ncbi:MAG: hypothetical protein MI861_21935, partial [Pirellulales bacterium]|nr:hypothetical protein [Pirellulales bacterium]
MRNLLLSSKIFFSAVFVFSLFILSVGALADTFTVTNLNDMGAGSLRQAVLDANANMNGPGIVDQIVFDPSIVPGEIDLTTGQMLIEDDLTITGPPLDVGGVPRITIDAQTNSRIFEIDDAGGDIAVSISRLRFIRGGNVSIGGAIFNREELSIDSCVFEENKATGAGGAIANGIFGDTSTITQIARSTFNMNEADSGGAVLNSNTCSIQKITQSTFSQNKAVSTDGGSGSGGGGIINAGQIGEISQSTFSQNTTAGTDGASGGGGIKNIFTIGEITQSVFSENMATGSGSGGGGIHNFGTITKITQSTFSQNTANGRDGFGGGIINLVSIGEITHSTFNLNEAELGGGAIANQARASIEEISHSSFTGNMATSGGAIYNISTINTITHSDFSINDADTDGGAINNIDDIVEIIQSTFDGNMADVTGGAIANGIAGLGGPGLEPNISTITGCTFNENRSGDSGGAIQNFDGSEISEISSSTFSLNSALLVGGAINNAGFATRITNSTFSGNYADGELNPPVPHPLLVGAISNTGVMNILFSTIAGNTASATATIAAGGVYNGSSALLTIKNSIVGDNSVFDCAGEDFFGLGDNLDSDGSCAALDTNMTFTTPLDLGLDPAGLQDNGGPTETIALCTAMDTPTLGCAGASAALDAVTDCTNSGGFDVNVDQRFFPRPFNFTNDPMDLCDIGAFEAQPTGKLTIIKETDPPGGSGFEFTGTGFPEGCEMDGMFTLDDMEMIMCIVPAEDLDAYNVAETPLPGVFPEIICDDGTLPDGPASVTVDIDEGDDVTCTFVNGVPTEVKITKFTVPESDALFD